MEMRGRASAFYTIYYGIAGHSACVPSVQRRPPRISPPHCLLAGASLILLSWSIRRILRESKRLRSVASIQKVTCQSLFGFLYLSDARRDERDGFGSDLCSWQGIAQAV